MSANLFATIRTPVGASQTVAYTGTAGSIGATLPIQANSVMVMCTSIAFVRISFGTNATAATTTDYPVPAGVPVILPLQRPTSPGVDNGLCWVSAIQSAAGGNLHVQGLVE